MTYEYLDDRTALAHGDCLDVMRGLPDDYVDAIVTDPPYGLGFMGKAWDELPPGEDWAKQCLRVMKPGGHLLAFGGTRTWHRLAVAVEDGGFETRDSIAWMHGQGFPKGSSQLKPSFEPIVLARKPFVGTVAANVQAHGTGALNIDATRVDAKGRPRVSGDGKGKSRGTYGDGLNGSKRLGTFDLGRWPANVTLDEAAAAELDRQSGGASRFFYVAKASAKERPKVDGVTHPTVKPLALMRWLVRLVTPPDGILLDPFAGTGTTLQAARIEGFRSLGIEREIGYLPLIRARFAA